MAIVLPTGTGKKVLFTYLISNLIGLFLMTSSGRGALCKQLGSEWDALFDTTPPRHQFYQH